MEIDYGFLSGGGEAGALIRAHNWAATPLGPVEAWPQSLRTSVSLCLKSRFAILIWWGPELVKLYNDAYASILGRKHPAALGARGRDVWPEIWHIIGPMLEGVLERGEATWSDDLLLELERNGYPEECYFTFSYSPIHDESGGVGGIFTPVQETTEQVIGERRLRTLRDLAESARALKAGSIADLCAVARDTLSRNPHDVPFAIICRPEDESAVPDWLARVSEIETAQVLTIPPGAEGISSGAWPVPPSEALAIPLTTPGRRIGTLVLGVSPRKRLEGDYRSFFDLVAGHLNAAFADILALEEQRRRGEALAELDRTKTAFFSNVSHEFRTPLTLMLAPLEEILSGDEAPAGVKELVSTTWRNGLRLQRLVNTLLDFSRIEAGRLRASFEPVDLSGLTAELASTFRSAMERAGLTLTVDCPPLPEQAYVDREMWEKVVLNLLSNAFKYTFEGGVTVRTQARGGQAILTVEDTGTGIPAHELPHIFERFHRVEGARGRTQEGTGIGLALVAELIRMHGGTVEARSTEGQGSIFTVSLPLGLAHLRPERVIAPDPTSAHSPLPEVLPDAPTGARPGGGAGGKVLVVDDNADMREYLARLLGHRYQVLTAANGEEAMGFVREDPPDLILSDVMMPVLDGFGLLSALRADPATAAIPVILLSARAGEEASVEGLSAGATDYLAKPFTVRELLARVGAHIEMARARSQTNEVLESITDGFVALDSDWRFTYINAAGESALGLRREDALGRVFQDVFAATVGTVFEIQYRRCMDEKVPVEFEALYDDWQRWFAVKAYPIRTGGISIYFRDITRRKQADEALRENEARLRAITDNIFNLAWMADADGDIFWYNKRWYEYTGCSFEEMSGWGWKSVHDPEVLPIVMERWGESLRTGESFEMEFPLLGADGRFRWFLTQIRPVRDESGKVVRWFGTNTDIDDKKKAEQLLRESEELARSVMEGNPDAVAVLDGEGRTLMINAQGRRRRTLTGEYPGCHWVDSWRPEDRAAAREAFRMALAGQHGCFEGSAIRENGARVWWDVSVTPLRTSEGAASRLLCIARDVTVARQTEEDLRQTAKLESLGVMAGGIAHDFNNLLTGILGNASLLGDSLSEEDRPLAADIVLAAERAADLTRQMLAYAGKGRFEISRIDLSAMVREMLRLLRPTIPRNVEVRLDLNDGCTLDGDPGQIQQVVMNILINAGEAMEGRPGEIRIRTGCGPRAEHPDRSEAFLEVSDTGKGMDEKTLSRIFDPFFTTKFTGRGLGLAAVSGIVRGHKGTMDVRSAPGEGTTFTVTFPASEKAAASVKGTGRKGEKLNLGVVLLADDEDLVLRLGEAVLQRYGFDVRTACDGRQAVEIFRAEGEGIDLIVLDMMMPVMGGEEALRLIREIDEEVPVIVCSGYNEVEVIRRFTAERVGAFLQKPYTASVLVEKVRELLGKAG
jgi:PAS domain S-box-containing protein